jgi:hypothetical protein
VEQPGQTNPNANHPTNDLSRPLPPQHAASEQHAAAQQQNQIPARDNRRRINPIRYVWNALGRVVIWIDGHNGFFTALATVAIAALTYYLVSGADRQEGVMEKQLTVMQVELAPRLEIDIRRDLQPAEQRWDITVDIVNTGHSDALDYYGWDDFQVWHAGDDLNYFDFMTPWRKPLPSKRKGDVVIAGQRISNPTHQLSFADATDILLHGGLVMTWGYLEYHDRFGVLYTARHCQMLTFQREANNNGALELPKFYRSECNARTETEPKQ